MKTNPTRESFTSRAAGGDRRHGFDSSMRDALARTASRQAPSPNGASLRDTSQQFAYPRGEFPRSAFPHGAFPSCACSRVVSPFSGLACEPFVGAGRRGTILVVVLLAIAALAGMVLVIARAARVEAMTSGNHVAAAQAAAAERAAEQYVVALLASQRDTVMTLDQSYFAAVPVGNAGAFWLVRPDYGDPALPQFGLVDEPSKLNLNRVTGHELLGNFPSIPRELAYSIVDWRDANDDVTEGGAEDAHYAALPTPYHCKNASFETVEELLLVRGAYPELLYGDGVTGTPARYGIGAAAIGGLSEQDVLARGLFNYLTVYSRQPATSTGGGGGAWVAVVSVAVSDIGQLPTVEWSSAPW